ncbi:hypothetical protein CDEST_13697 [Colletotrichum destructivum]|uniref:Uncharacterized protein n=1 Tax=Colletotrichum destructivum TaxID=34406 RepID=A0AAX4IZY1_9PEZI|nr:hypothetical protein CDEST_13697 [Colletotrichum destructivum]
MAQANCPRVGGLGRFLPPLSGRSARLGLLRTRTPEGEAKGQGTAARRPGGGFPPSGTKVGGW